MTLALGGRIPVAEKAFCTNFSVNVDVQAFQQKREEVPFLDWQPSPGLLCMIIELLSVVTSQRLKAEYIYWL
jgi:hypothetical protein